MITVADLPSVQRDLYLSRCIRRVEDLPSTVETLRVEWQDMIVSFATNEAISECSVEVAEAISLPVFTRRLESLLDCGAKISETASGASGAEWTLKWSDRISRYGDDERVRCLLCDKIAQIDGETGETIGVLKIKRRSVKAGHAKIRLVPKEDSLQVICRHSSAQGLKAVWKSVLWRLRPQYGGSSENNEQAETPATSRIPEKGFTVVAEPCILVEEYNDGSYYLEALEFLSEQGCEVEVGKDIKEVLPLDFGLEGDLNSSFAVLYCEVAFNKRVPANMPDNLSLSKNGDKIYVAVRKKRAKEFRERAWAMSNWLGLNWDLPELPESK